MVTHHIFMKTSTHKYTMREFINIVEGATKLRPTDQDLKEISNIVHLIRSEECGGGQCHNVSAWIQERFGWTRAAGTYLSRDGEVIIGGGHYWNILPDGSILDATADQIGEGHAIRIVDITDPDHERYDMEWYEDYHPKHTDYAIGDGRNKRNPELFTGEMDSDAENRLASERGSHWWIDDKKHIEDYYTKQKQYRPNKMTEGVGDGLSVIDIIRWVDYRAARSYARSNKIIGRTKHWLPKTISKLDKVYKKRGISFGIPGSQNSWNAHGASGVAFIINRTRLNNQIVDINGHAVYLFGQSYEARSVDPSWETIKNYHDIAVSDSQKSPDEAFILGDIDELGKVLSKIIVGREVDQHTQKILLGYGEQYGVTVEMEE